jgi:hypothetical protein
MADRESPGWTLYQAGRLVLGFSCEAVRNADRMSDISTRLVAVISCGVESVAAADGAPDAGRPSGWYTVSRFAG